MTEQPPWHWRMERAWLQGAGRWAAWVAALSLLTLALSVVLVANRHAQQARVELESHLNVARSPTQGPAKPVDSEPVDFVRALGAAVPSANVVHEIQRACSQAGVTLATLQLQERLPTLEQLGRIDFTLTLRGTYPATKQAIKQMVERFPSVTVKRLRMQRTPDAAEVESAVMLSLWSAPLLPSASATAPVDAPR